MISRTCNFTFTLIWSLVSFDGEQCSLLVAGVTNERYHTPREIWYSDDTAH